MKTTKIVYYVSTVLISLLMLMGAYTELSYDQGAQDLMIHLGYPLYMLSILGVAKILGVIGLWQNKISFLREWAYAGFFIDIIGAFFSHIAVGDTFSKYAMAVVALIVLSASYYSFKKLQVN